MSANKPTQKTNSENTLLVTISMPKDEKLKAMEQAKKEGRSVSNLMLMAFKEYMSKRTA